MRTYSNTSEFRLIDPKFEKELVQEQDSTIENRVEEDFTDPSIAATLYNKLSEHHRWVLAGLKRWGTQSTRSLVHFIHSANHLAALNLRGTLWREAQSSLTQSILQALLNRLKETAEDYGFYQLNLEQNFLSKESLLILEQILKTCPSLTDLTFDEPDFNEDTTLSTILLSIKSCLEKNQRYALMKKKLYQTVQQSLSSTEYQPLLKFLLSLDGFNQKRLELVQQEQRFELNLEKRILNFQQDALSQQQRYLDFLNFPGIDEEIESQLRIQIENAFDTAYENITDFVHRSDQVWEKNRIIATQDSINSKVIRNNFIRRYCRHHLEKALNSLLDHLEDSIKQRLNLKNYENQLKNKQFEVTQLKQNWKERRHYIEVYAERINGQIALKEQAFKTLQTTGQLPMEYNFLQTEEQGKEFIAKVCCTQKEKDELLHSAYKAKQVEAVECLMKSGANVFFLYESGDSIFQQVIKSDEDSAVRQQVLEHLQQDISTLQPNETATTMSKEEVLLNDIKTILLNYLEEIKKRDASSFFWRLITGVMFCRHDRQIETEQYFKHVLNIHQYDAWETIHEQVLSMLAMARSARRGLRRRSFLHDQICSAANTLKEQLEQEKEEVKQRLQKGQVANHSLQEYYKILELQSKAFLSANTKKTHLALTQKQGSTHHQANSSRGQRSRHDKYQYTYSETDPKLFSPSLPEQQLPPLESRKEQSFPFSR